MLYEVITVRPVSGLAEAQGRIALLEDREADLERRAAGRWAAAESEVNAGIAELRRRWAPMDEGGKVTAEERAGAIRSILGSGPSAVGTEESVITSYSIHYTKLYETPCAGS